MVQVKKIFLTLLLGILLVSTASAYFLPTKDYNSETETIKIDNAFGLLGKVAEYNLTYNTEQCLINCYAEGTATLHEAGQLFSDLNFENKYGDNIFIKNKVYVLLNENYIEEVIDEETKTEKCETTSNGTTTCANYYSYKNETKQREVWKIYNGEKLDKGTYKWRVEGNKKIGESVDWIASAFGTDLKEWAWWNYSWTDKRQINLTASVGNFSYLSNINYSAEMQTDFDDLRFVDYATESIELNYTIESKNDGANATIRINSIGADKVMMYYGNAGASSIDSSFNTHYKPVSFWYLDGNANDSIGLNNATIINAVSNLTDYKIKSAYSFNGASDNRINVTNSASLNISGAMTISFWIKTGTTNVNVLGKGNRVSSPNAGYLFLITGGNKMFFSVQQSNTNPTTAISTTDVQDNVWHHIVGVYYPSSRVEIWVDGINEANGTTNIQASQLLTTNPFYIGNLADLSTDYAGLLDEVIIYNKSLNYYEINALRNYTAPTYVVGGEETLGGITVTLSNPINAYNSTNQTINFNATLLPTNLNLTNVTFRINYNTTYVIENFTTLSGNESIVINWTETLSDGDHIWNVTACGDGDVGTECDTSEDRTLFIDSTNPTIVLNAGNGTFDFGILTTNHTINYTITDTHLSSCWLNYNSTNVSIPCTSGVLNTTNFTLQYGIYNATIYANDSFGNEESLFFSWDYKVFQNNVSYNSVALETAAESFILNITTQGMIIPTSTFLNYSNTSYSGIVTLSGNNYLISRTIDIAKVNDTGNETFNFLFSVNGTNITTQYYNQTVGNINFTSCTGTPTNLVYNFTTYANLSTVINASLEANFEFSAVTGSGAEVETFDFESIDENKSNFMFCLNSSGINVSTSAIISFYDDGYDRREYLIEDDNIIGGIYKNISLLLELTTVTDIVTVILNDQNYNLLENYLVSVQRWNIGTNTYSTEGMLETNSEGEGIINLELYNVWYRAIVSYNGSIVKVTEPKKLSDVTWPIMVTLGVTNPYSLFNSISYGVVFDNTTNITTYTWIDAAENVETGCLIIKNKTSLGYDTINSECLNSSSGIINYELSGDGEYEITGLLYLIPTYNVSKLTDVLYARLGIPSLTAVVHGATKVLSMVIIGTIAAIGIASGSPLWAYPLLLIAIFMTGKLGWLNINDAILWGLVAIVIVGCFRLAKK